MTGAGFAGLFIIVVTVLFSYRGFTSRAFFSAFEFNVEKVRLYKEYKRLLTSGLLHINWVHLLFNMFSLYAFSGALENELGAVRFMVIYAGSLAGGDLLSLFIHRNQPEYSSIGASGAICGIIFASIALFPGMHIGLFLLPFSMPAWIYGIAFVAFSIYGIKSNKVNIGHDAHLGGALVGMLIALLMEPFAFADNYKVILLIALPTIAFIYLIITRPYLLLVDNFYFNRHKNYYSIDHKYNEEKNISQKEIDQILDKISSRGMSSLSRKEKDMLKRHSQNVL